MTLCFSINSGLQFGIGVTFLWWSEVMWSSWHYSLWHYTGHKDKCVCWEKRQKINGMTWLLVLFFNAPTRLHPTDMFYRILLYSFTAVYVISHMRVYCLPYTSGCLGVRHQWYKVASHNVNTSNEECSTSAFLDTLVTFYHSVSMRFLWFCWKEI